jgi:putative nucleotidyltransferase with HDIG domain
VNRPVLTFYVRLVVAAGGGVVLHSIVGLLHAPHPLEWFLFAALTILAGSFTLNISAIDASISVADTFLIASTLLFGPAPATVALAIDTFVISWRKRHRWSQVAFNAVAPALSLWIAGQTFFLMTGVEPLATTDAAIGPLVAPLLCLAGIYFVLNSGLMAVAVGLESGRSPLQIWHRHFLWLALGYFAAASVALGLILVVRQVGDFAVAVVLPVLAIFHHTLRSSFGRLEDAQRHVTQIDRLYRSTVETLAMAIDAKDDVTHSHVRRVQAYAGALARALGVADEPTLRAIEAAALLHDTGKLAVPERILNKPGGLTPAEFEQMKRHVDIGADILSLVEFPYPVVPIVRCHHESWDGSGYPRGVAGEDIPIGARILSVVDCFDALTSDRPYRRRLTDDAALDILRERRGRMYDPAVVDMFVKIRHGVVLTDADAPEHLEVMQQINRSLQTDAPVAAGVDPAIGAAPPKAVADEVLAFVSLARLASGAVAVSDILALSTNLIRNIAPDTTGAWYLMSEAGDRLVAADAFGAAAASLRGASILIGDKLTGWVAANRQVIVNSDAALDLGAGAAHATPPLKSALSVPLLAGDAVVAVLTLYAGERDAFTDDHGRLIQMLAPHLAQAIQSARDRAAQPQPQFQGARDLKLVASR